MLVEANVKRNYRMKQIGFTRYLAGRHGQHKDSHKDSSVLGSLSPPMDDARVLGYRFWVLVCAKFCPSWIELFCNRHLPTFWVVWDGLWMIPKTLNGPGDSYLWRLMTCGVWSPPLLRWMIWGSPGLIRWWGLAYGLFYSLGFKDGGSVASFVHQLLCNSQPIFGLWQMGWWKTQKMQPLNRSGCANLLRSMLCGVWSPPLLRWIMQGFRV